MIVTSNEELSYNASNMGVWGTNATGLKIAYFTYTKGYTNSTTMYDDIITGNKINFEYCVIGDLIEFGN